MTHGIPLRREIERKNTWNIESVFPSDEAWEAEFKMVDDRLPGLTLARGHLGDGPSVLADWLDLSEQIGVALGKVTLYASMGYAVDTTDQAAAAKNDRARGLATRVSAAGAFAEPEILAIGAENLQKWMQVEDRLQIYAHYFDRLERRRAHVRSAEVEALLSQLSDPFRTAAATHGILADADLKFLPALSAENEPHEVAQGTINALRTHPDPIVRRTAWESYADAHLAVKNTMANCIAAGVKQDVFLSRARGYNSSLDAALTSNDIPLEVFYNLIETFRRHLPTWHRYWDIRRRALGRDRLGLYDEKAPLTNATPVVPFTQAVEWISEGMNPLGDEYVDVLRRGLLEERWVDIYPNEGKRSGAFSTGSTGTLPFILMSYHDDLFSLSTLAHELGHSMHKYYAHKAQPFIYSRYGIFLAETASNFNQAMVRAHLLATHPDPEFQIAVIEEAMSNFHRYFFLMPTLARFELEVHERVEGGGALTAEGMIGLMADLFEEGYGDGVEIDRERIGITWAQFATHLYSNFYVYQYATGISAAHALAQGILSGNSGSVDRYLGFLKAGGSVYPLDALRSAGVDLTTPEPVEKTFGVLARMVERLEELMASRSGFAGTETQADSGRL
ncbi:MAG: oligoendopeptidase F [Chloroflexi bacterium]|nr:oligoendopeptidase F [Chloroflexota bacterium]